jgi:hypothetical protein
MINNRIITDKHRAAGTAGASASAARAHALRHTATAAASAITAAKSVRVYRAGVV